MKKNPLTLAAGAILLVIFGVLLFTFQVRQTEVVVVTTFDEPTRTIEKPGLNFKWPLPIQKVYRFDRRVQNFESKFEESLTRDKLPLLVQVYVGWVISKPDVFFSSFPGGTAAEAEPALEGLIRSEQSAVLGQHPFTHFIATDEAQLKFIDVESEILQRIQAPALKNYGVDIKFLGIKKLGLPESVTEKVFVRMQAERQREVERLKALGEAEATKIKSAADRDRAQILAKAEAEATAIRGQADAEAEKSYAVFEQNPELAIFLRKLKALEETLKDRATLILDERTPPFDLLKKSFESGNGASK